MAFKAVWWVQTGMNRVMVDWIIRKDLPTFTSIKDHLREGATSYFIAIIVMKKKN